MAGARTAAQCQIGVASPFGFQMQTSLDVHAARHERAKVLCQVGEAKGELVRIGRE